MRHPFQCIHAIDDELLIAACGPKLLSFSLKDGEILSQWPADEVTSAPVNEIPATASDEPPAKKQKTSKATKAAPKAPNIIKLAVSEDQEHVVAVTDDKVVRVFALDDECQLTELSQRTMPKRPCAIQVLPDNATVLLGDKFGDVYSLPLIASEADSARVVVEESAEQPEQKFKSSATTLTVHSQRNRQALEAQLKTKFVPRKDPLTFEHKLLLGHVSMLTDMKYVTTQVDEKERSHIITSDRDEHIRISRGPPQAHVIEGFCLGHESFVSKICRIGETNLLVSGGGDDWLGVWDFMSGKLLRKFDLMKHVRKLPGGKSKDFQLSVSGIWNTSITTSRGMSEEQIIIVACEKVKALFFIAQSALTDDLGEDDGPSASFMAFDKCPLDVTCVGDRVIISLDSRVDSPEEGQERLQACWARKKGSERGSAIQAEWDNEHTGFDEPLKTLNDFSGPEKDATHKDMDELFYSVANLRKRRDQENQDGEDAAEAPEASEAPEVEAET